MVKGNFLTFNASKCKYMLINFHAEGKVIVTHLTFCLTTCLLRRLNGIILTSDLSCSSHVQSICTKYACVNYLVFSTADFISMTNHQHYYIFIFPW